MQKLRLAKAEKVEKGIRKVAFPKKIAKAKGVTGVRKPAFGLPAIMPLRGLLGVPRVLVVDIPRGSAVRAAVEWENISTATEGLEHPFDFLVVYGTYDSVTGNFNYITYDGTLLGGIVEDVVATVTPMTTNVDAAVPDIEGIEGTWDAMTIICDYDLEIGFPDGITTTYDSRVDVGAITITTVAPPIGASILGVLFSRITA